MQKLYCLCKQHLIHVPSLTTLAGKGKSTNTILQDVIQGKDIFELNENPADIVLSGLSDIEYEDFIHLPDHIKQGDLGNWIKKSHWQSNSELCSIDGCKLSLGLVSGRGNCFRCGSEVCNDHYRFQAKLSINANFDPVNGIWARICYKCHQNRIGFMQSLGVIRRRTSSFIDLRTVNVAKSLMEVNKIEIRLKKLSEFRKQSTSIFEPITLLLNLIVREDDTIPWEPDSSKSNCSICDFVFTFINRRHHCRLCGLLICNSCSKAINISNDNVLRSCPNCAYYIYLGKSRQDIINTPYIVSLYNSYTRFKESIQNKLSTFNALLLDIQSRIGHLTFQDQDYLLALRLRKDLLDLFAEVDQIGKKIIHDGKNMPEGSLSRRLHESIYVSILNFLQMNMFTLQLLPSISKSTENKLGNRIRLDDIQGQAILDSIRQLELDKEMIKKSVDFGDKDAVNVLDDQIKQLKEELESHLASL